MFWNSKYNFHRQLQIKKQLNHTFLTVSAKLCWVYCLLFRILFKDFLTSVFRQIFLLKKTTILAPQTRLNNFSSNNLVPTERQRVGRVGENPGNEVVHPNPWKFWNFLTCHYIFPLRIAGLIFVVSEPIQGFVQRPLDSDSGWQELFFLYALRPFYFRWALQESCNRYFRDISLKIYRIFTVLYALIVPAKIIFFQHHCDCVYGKSSGNHDLLQKAYPVSIEINPTVIELW